MLKAYKAYIYVKSSRSKYILKIVHSFEVRKYVLVNSGQKTYVFNMISIKPK